MSNDNFKHKEAFALMWYACEPPTLSRLQSMGVPLAAGCGHRERIWNSRDGVTPFGGLICTSCGASGLNGGMRHVDWHLDAPMPGHRLRIGQLFFRDGTTADAITIIKRRIRILKLRGQPVPDDIAERLLNDARHDVGDEWPKGWPMVDRFDRAMAHRAGYNDEELRGA